MAPPGMRPAVTWFLVTLPPAPPPAKNPPTESGPCAAAQTRPLAACKGVWSSVPPCKDLASPRLLTVTSMALPLWTKGGRVAVTMTAATFFNLQRARRDGDAELLQHGGDGLRRERHAGPVARAVQADDQAVADELVAAHPLHDGDVFQAALRVGASGQEQPSSPRASGVCLKLHPGKIIGRYVVN